MCVAVQRELTNMKSMTAFFLAVGASAVIASTPLPVSAQSLQLDLNNGRIGIVPEAPQPQRYRRPSPEFERERAGISCGEGGQIVRERGFRNVRPVDCNGRAFTYAGQRRGELFEIRVSSLDGSVLSVEAN